MPSHSALSSSLSSQSSTARLDIDQSDVFCVSHDMPHPQTLWTNREVKLADVLGKIIVPVNLLARWPPQCLAIQFATTQYVSWPHSNTNMEWNGEVVARVTKEIVERYGVETSVLGEMGDGVIKVDGEGGEEEEVEEIVTMDAEERHQSFARADTLRISEEREGVRSGGISLPVPQLLSQRRSTIKSYASVLPSSLPLKYRKSIQESRVGKPLVVISCHTAQQEYAREVSRDMEGCGYETWCSCDILHLPVENASPIFQLRANEAGAVVFIFSKEFTENSFCENQVYYCEQRKSIIPVVYEPIQLPHWICLLIGTSPFISCQSSDHRQQLVERVRDALNPVKREVSLRAMLQEKAQVARLRAEVTATLPKGRSLVYISGGTHFYSEHGEEICQQLGRRLAQDSSVVLVTGGFFGVGETVGRSFHEERERLGGASEVWHIIAERDDQDKSSQTRQNEDGSFPALPYGKTIFAGMLEHIYSVTLVTEYILSMVRGTTVHCLYIPHIVLSLPHSLYLSLLFLSLSHSLSLSLSVSLPLSLSLSLPHSPPPPPLSLSLSLSHSLCLSLSISLLLSLSLTPSIYLSLTPSPILFPSLCLPPSLQAAVFDRER